MLVIAGTFKFLSPEILMTSLPLFTRWLHPSAATSYGSSVAQLAFASPAAGLSKRDPE